MEFIVGIVVGVLVGTLAAFLIVRSKSWRRRFWGRTWNSYPLLGVVQPKKKVDPRE